MLAHFTKENVNAVNIKCLISFCLALSRPNTPTECAFSIINALWSHEKKKDLRNSESLNHCEDHFKDFSCSEFSQISKVFLEQVHKSDIHMNLGRLSQSMTYILFLYEFF
jgi:predicted outer membrane lipoprotein